MYELIAIAETKVYVLNQSRDPQYLDQIVADNDGVCYFAGQFCDLKVQRAGK